MLLKNKIKQIAVAMGASRDFLQAFHNSENIASWCDLIGLVQKDFVDRSVALLYSSQITATSSQYTVHSDKVRILDSRMPFSMKSKRIHPGSI